MIEETLKQYVEQEILPRYNSFDAAHRVDHARMVITQSLKWAAHYDVDENMVYAIAAYHDIGLAEGRESHHVVSGRMLLADDRLHRWFTPAQLALMAEAVEDHRASADHAPRSIYGCIVAEADRMIVPETIIRRTVQYGLAHYPELDKEGHYRRTVAHMHEKYAEGGYLKLWIPFSDNSIRLEELRRWISDESVLREVFERMWSECHAQG